MSSIIDMFRNDWNDVTSVDDLFESPDPQSGSGNNADFSKRPSWNDVLEGYPRDGSGNDEDAVIVFKDIFGSAYDEQAKVYIENKGKPNEKRIPMSNACATRVSLGLNNANFRVRRDFTILTGSMKGKGVILSAIGLKNWLIQGNILGKPDVFISTKEGNYKGQQGRVTLKDVQEKIGNRNGIYIIIPFPGCFTVSTGHATLWISSQKDTIGNHSYSQCIGEVYFWELP